MEKQIETLVRLSNFNFLGLKPDLKGLKNTAMLAGGAYIGYKLGKAVGSFGHGGWGGYPSSYYYGYAYGPYYHGYSPYYAGPSRFYGAGYNRFE